MAEEFAERYAAAKPRLERAGYCFAGDHSAVKVCLWAKRALLGNGSCYKQRFYGIESHRCLQMTPAMPACNQRCVFCWRDTTLFSEGWPASFAADEPGKIIDDCVAGQRKLLTGFKGNAKADKGKWLEAQEPNQAAISLDGEPTLYPRLPELIREFRARGYTTFLVTNGTRPDVLRRLADEDALPTQLYVSLCAPTRDVYEKINLPVSPDNWDKLNETLTLLPSLETRKALRLTLVKGLNAFDPAGYARLCRIAKPDFVECKSYMHVGYSLARLGAEAMLSHDEVRAFAREFADASGYLVTDEQPESRVVLLCRDADAAANRVIKRLRK
ncbi:MAG: 4-demethylwyosine synthase TYW1 [Candidatus Micrarchaeia archaeon]